jgi:hypothetical protein
MTLAALAVLATVFVAGSSANLAGSTFEGNDGNLVVDTAGNTDWANAPNRVVGLDVPSGPTDNSFGQGTKEDNPNVTIVTGSIPPQKNDLTRFYVGSEFAGGSNYLYLAWERAVNIGNANMDLEINQNATAGFTGTSTGSLTLNRTAGDLLVTYDFSGSGTPSLHLLTWVTSGATSQCFLSNSLPCWGNRVDLTGNSEGAVNTSTVTDPVPPNAPRTLTAGLFGEAAINLTAAGVFPAGTCKAFGSTFLKSRASSSFGAEVKDFIAPQPVNISNCGDIKVIKQTDPRGVDQVFSYTSNFPANSVAGGVACPGNSGSGIQADGSFCLNDAGNAGKTPGSIDPAQNSSGNTVDTGQIQAGTYTVTEGADPTGFQFESLSCSGGTTSTSGKTATITLAPDDSVTCLYVNQQQLGAIRITKTSSKAAATPLAGATFSITGPNNYSNSVTTGSDGTACVDGLVFGGYTVTETAAPPGYAIDNPNPVSVTVDHNASCSSGTPNAPQTFTDTPLTDITATATSEAPGGTQSTITCVDSSNANIGDSPQGPAESAKVTANGLKPGTYTCTVVVDP